MKSDAEHGFGVIPMSELEKDLGDVLYSDASCIERWSDFSFTTPEGRNWGLFLGGMSIKKRLEAASVLVNKHDNARLKKTAGMILEIGGEPMIYGDNDALIAAWVALHELHGVPFTDEEREVLGLDSTSESEDGTEE